MAVLPPIEFIQKSFGNTSKGGFWVTTLMYTENEADAAGFKEKMNDNKNFKDFPYTKLFGICDQSQQQYPEKFKEKWGR